jgi:ribosomal protein S24E
LSIKDIKAKVSEKFGAPVDNIALFNLETKFGGGKSVATCLIYDSVDQKIKIEPRYRLLRVVLT